MVKELLSQSKIEIPFFIFIICYILVSFLGMYFCPLFDEDEGFFAEAARQMMAKNNYVLVSVNDEVRYDKPALFFWFTAFSMYIFGQNELAARLPSFCFFVLSLYLFYHFTLKYFSKKIAQNTVIIAAILLQFQVLGRAAVSDNLLNLCVSGALFLAYNFIKKQNSVTLFCFYTLAGIGFFAKGPIAFLVIFGVLIFYIIATKKIYLFRDFFNIWYLIWCIFIPLPWFYLAYRQSGDLLFSDFIIKHNLGRFTSTMESHGGYLWYYIPVLFLSFIPFSHLIFKAFTKTKLNDLNLFLIIWFLLPLLFFSFSKTQLPHYISVGYFPLILLLSQLKNLNEKWIFFQMISVIIIFLIVPILARYISIQDVFVNELLKNSNAIFNKEYWFFMGLLLVCILCVRYYSRQMFVYASIIFLVAVNVFIYKISVLQQASVKEMGLFLKEKKYDVLMTDHYNPSLSFYAKRVFKINSKPPSNVLFFSKVTRDSSYFASKYIVKSNGYFLGKK